MKTHQERNFLDSQCRRYSIDESISQSTTRRTLSLMRTATCSNVIRTGPSILTRRLYSHSQLVSLGSQTFRTRHFVKGSGLGTDLYVFIQMPYLLFTDKVRAQNGDKFRSIFSDNLQPIATRGKKARGTLLVDKHCGNGCSIKRAPVSVSYYNEISGGHIGRAVVRTRCSTGPVLPLWG